MKLKIAAIAMMAFSFAMNAQINFTKDITVNVNSPKELTDANNNSLKVNSTYKIQLITRGTATKTGAEYLAWADDSQWRLRAVNLKGINSNHPILVIENNIIKLKTNHTSNYAVRAFVTELNAVVNGASANAFGSSAQWQRETNNLFYNDGNVGIGVKNPRAKLDINGNTFTGSLSARRYLKIVSKEWPEIRFQTPARNEEIRVGVSHAANSQYLIDEGDFYVYSASIGAMPLIVKKEGNILLGNKLGNVAIGHTHPTSKLDIQSNQNTQIKLKSSSPTHAVGISFQGQRSSSSNLSSHYIGTDGDSHFNFRINADEALKFQTNSADRMIVYGNGNVGIGTTVTPSNKLQINGNISNQTGSGGTLTLFDDNTTRRNRIILGADAQGAYIKSTWGNSGTSAISFRDHNNVKTVNILRGGNVGIGTTTTGSHKLAVEGSIGAREIKVQASGWADFVFENNYKLPTLKDVEKHIKEKGHLENIPSAVEVKKDGFFLGEMDAKLLQKIEELTLYTIDQEKKLKTQEDKIEKLEKENSVLKSLLERVSKLEKQVNKQ